MHIAKQWQQFDADNVSQEKRTFVLRPVAKTLSGASAAVENDVECKKKILADCPVLATVLSADSRSNDETLKEQCRSQTSVPLHKLQSSFADNDADVKTSVPCELLNGNCTLTNGSATATYCKVCGLECGDISVIGKHRTGIHKLYVSPVDAVSASSLADTKRSLSLPFFPFLAHPSSPVHGKVTSVCENVVPSCTVCYVNLNRQWQRFEMSRDVGEQHRWQREYTYQMVDCDVCHGSVERGKMTVVSQEELLCDLQSADSSVEGLNLVCERCRTSPLSPAAAVEHKSLVDSENSTKNAAMVSFYLLFPRLMS